MSSELGTLVVVVLKAKNLMDKHFYKQDVFAQVSLHSSSSPTPTVKRTAVDVKAGQTPLWDQEIRLSVSKEIGSGGKNRTLEVSCWSKEHRKEDLLGMGTLDITETLRTGEFDDWIKLETNGTYCGEIYLEMTFYANAPAPLTRRVTKMNPKDRLTRPTNQLPVTTFPTGNHLLPLPPQSPPTSFKAPSSFPTGAVSSPPPSLTKAHIPASLAAGPGSGARPNAVRPIPANPSPAPVPGLPSILRPGLGITSPSTRIAPQAPPTGIPTAHPQAPVAPPPASSYTNTCPNPPPISFPVASVSDARAPSYDNFRPSYEPPYSTNLPEPHLSNTRAPSYGSFHPSHEPSYDTNIPDPFLSIRYQSPLPLPPGFSRPAPSAPSPYSTPAPFSSSPRRDPAAEAAEIRRAAALQQEEELRWKKEQEDADEELARRLDEELNLDRGAGERAGSMPGGW